MAAVEDLITSARDYAADLVERADDVLDTMQEDISRLGYTVVYPGSIVFPDAPDIPDDLVAPELAQVDLVLPTEPAAAPQFQDISPIEVGAVPTFNVAAPTVVIPSAPAALGGFNEVAPTINTDYTFPEPPDQLTNPIITPPVLPDRVAPAAPTIALPSFDAVAPVNDAVAPTDLPGQLATAYGTAAPQFTAALSAQMDGWMAQYNPQFHTQLARIEAQLQRYLDGGTGLSSTVEDAIYERSRTKQDAEARRSSSAAFDQMAGRGFTVPGAAVAAALRASRQAAADNNAAAAREIVVMQAEMEQKNLQFAVTTSAGMRQAALSAMLSYHGNLVQINGQALQYASTVVDTLVRVYNIQVEAFRARLSAYQVEAQVYDTRLKAAMSYVELYKAEIDALQALTQVDQAKVAVYRSQIDALLGLANVYKARVETVVEQANLERLKLDVFRTKTEAYLATVQAKRAEYDAYNAAISGQEAQVRVYGAQVQAFNAQLTGYKTQIDAQSEVVRAQAATNESRGANYRATLSGYQTVVQARGEQARTQLQVQNQAFAAFDSQVRATLGNASLRNDVYRTRSDVLIRNAELETSALLRNQANVTATSRAIADVGISSANVFQGLASSYMASMNTLVAQTQAE